MRKLRRTKRNAIACRIQATIGTAAALTIQLWHCHRCYSWCRCLSHPLAVPPFAIINPYPSEHMQHIRVHRHSHSHSHSQSNTHSHARMHICAHTHTHSHTLKLTKLFRIALTLKSCSSHNPCCPHSICIQFVWQS